MEGNLLQSGLACDRRRAVPLRGGKAGLGPIFGNRLATGPEVLNDPFFGEVYQWAIPKLQLSRTVLQRDLF